VAKLDRLARNVAFTAALMESKVDFVACDNPHANKFTIHICRHSLFNNLSHTWTFHCDS
jgi:hypothetical protein